LHSRSHAPAWERIPYGSSHAGAWESGKNQHLKSVNDESTKATVPPYVGSLRSLRGNFNLTLYFNKELYHLYYLKKRTKFDR